MRVRVSFDYYPDESEMDPNDATGLTEEAYNELTGVVQSFGGDNIEVEKAADA